MYAVFEEMIKWIKIKANFLFVISVILVFISFNFIKHDILNLISILFYLFTFINHYENIFTNNNSDLLTRLFYYFLTIMAFIFVTSYALLTIFGRSSIEFSICLIVIGFLLILLGSLILNIFYFNLSSTYPQIILTYIATISITIIFFSYLYLITPVFTEMIPFFQNSSIQIINGTQHVSSNINSLDYLYFSANSLYNIYQPGYHLEGNFVKTLLLFQTFLSIIIHSVLLSEAISRTKKNKQIDIKKNNKQKPFFLAKIWDKNWKLILIIYIIIIIKIFIFSRLFLNCDPISTGLIVLSIV